MRKIFKIIVAFILCISLVASFFVDVFAETNIDLSKDYPYEQMVSDIKVLSEAYKDILKSKVIGTSCVELLHLIEGGDSWVIPMSVNLPSYPRSPYGSLSLSYII